MPNITLSIDEKLLKAGREYARKHNTSLNALVRKLLDKAVTKKNPGHLEKLFKLMDEAPVNSKGIKWTREELYDV